MPLDLESSEYEQMLWRATGEIRWRRPRGCNDNERVLEQLYERATGERRWTPVPTMLED